MSRNSLASGIAVMALAVTACARHGAPAAGTAGPSPADGSAVPWAGHVLHGGDPQALRQYLLTVREVQPIRFRVRWNPATVAIDKQAALRSLRRVSRDGATF